MKNGWNWMAIALDILKNDGRLVIFKANIWRKFPTHLRQNRYHVLPQQSYLTEWKFEKIVNVALGWCLWSLKVKVNRARFEDDIKRHQCASIYMHHYYVSESWRAPILDCEIFRIIDIATEWPIRFFCFILSVVFQEVKMGQHTSFVQQVMLNFIVLFDASIVWYRFVSRRANEVHHQNEASTLKNKTSRSNSLDQCRCLYDVVNGVVINLTRV